MKELKNSGISWVGKCPTHWQVMRNKYIMHKIKHIPPSYQGEAILSLSMKGVIVRDLEAGGKMPSSFNGYQTLYPGNLLMCLFDYDVTPRCIGLIKNYGVSSPAYSQFELDNGNVASYFYYYYLMVDNEKSILHLAKNLRHSFTEEQLGCIEAPVPPVKEQQAIASFLDEKCAEIDALVEDIQAEISTLEELKNSIITEAVTKGLNTNVKMKNSGISWVITCPKLWKIEKFKYHFKRRTTKNPGEVPVLSLYREFGIIPKDSRDDNHNITSEDTSKYLFVRKGDFVINKMKAWQGSVAVSEFEGIVSPAYYVYEFIGTLLYRKYLHYFMRNKSLATEFRRLSGGIREGQWDLSASSLENSLICIPPLQEQQAIADYLDAKCVEIEATIAEKKEQLSTLAEYKKSLIYEYVTGKKEVPQK